MMTSSNGNIFRVAGPLCGWFTGHHKGQWRGALIFSLICAWIDGCIDNRKAGDLRRHRAHYDVTVMTKWIIPRSTIWLSVVPGTQLKTRFHGPVSISEKTSYRKISWSLEAARFVFRIVWSLWNLTGTSAALLPMCLPNFKAILQFKVPISWLRDFTRSYEKRSFRILRQGPVCHWMMEGYIWRYESHT